MANIQCKMCGGMVEISDDLTSGVCPYCNSLTTFPKISDEQTEHLYSRAEHFRQKNDFDKAVAAYESILDVNNEDPEAYWGVVLSRFGIEYVEDPATHERIPTCHRVQYESILADSDYQNALKYASGSDRDIYEKEANRIAEIQKSILRISAQEKPYDVFICYKETTDSGSRTKDSTLAQDIYYQLTNQGLKVFFSRITLEDKLGQQYEPYIFAALNSAKVMLVIGSKKEYFEAVWVKNEWSRFLALKKKDRSRLLIPCYKDMDPYDIPEELSLFQSQDMSKIGFMQDLLRGVMKVVNATETSNTTKKVNSGNSNLMKRVSILMLQKEWNKAKSYCEEVLKDDPENIEIYLYLSMIDHQVASEEELRKTPDQLAKDKNFQVALQFASAERKKQLEEIQTQTLVNYYLHECMKANGISNEEALSEADTPLVENESFQNALAVAPLERKNELQQIQYAQAEHFLQRCMKERGVSSETELSYTSEPLNEDTFFLLTLKCSNTNRKEELLQIQYNQAVSLLQKCLETNHVSSIEELSHNTNPLFEDVFFHALFTLLKSVSPDDRKQMEMVQVEQISFFHANAVNGDVEACVSLGKCYFGCDCIPRDYGEAVKWFRKAATPINCIKAMFSAQQTTKGNATAQFYLGLCFEEGKGVKANKTEAVEWFRKAAEQGHAEAQYKMGRFYEENLSIRDTTVR